MLSRMRVFCLRSLPGFVFSSVLSRSGALCPVRPGKFSTGRGSAVVGNYVIVFVLAAQALTVLPLSVGYPVWAGGCAISTGVVGVLAFGERKTPSKAAGIALVVVGIIILDTLTPNPIG